MSPEGIDVAPVCVHAPVVISISLALGHCHPDAHTEDGN